MELIYKQISTVSNKISHLPGLFKLGLTLFFLAGMLDLTYHAVSMFYPNMLDPFFGPDGYYAHVLLFVGMLVTIIGVTQIKASHSEPDSKELGSFHLERR